MEYPIVEYLNSGEAARYFPDDYSDFVGIVHTVIACAFREDAEYLVFNSTGFSWSVDYKTIGTFRLDDLTATPTEINLFIEVHRNALEQVLNRDPIIKNHLEIIKHTDEELVLKLK